ncbi:bifunctional 2-polyprenyl-6-hydroxyphenol methylase/3-demethylubiquinol 3-O-methyltransferase UbiG [Helicobacter canis]|uniref:Putative methyltransferase n=1 Tax=Helicobacter canis TaxID=29419 RepID=A0A377J6X6_9HELI|nr:class I SAM-dependent methyltransferase [Helicobacter canis]STO97553.1 putative methyltransferase [Helicobacter canis]
MKPQPCILCHSNDTHITQEIARDDIIALYKSFPGVAIDSLISSDLLYHHCNVCDLSFFTCKDGSIPTGDNAFYNALNQLDWYYFSEKHEYHFAKKFITKDSKVLEVGCGKAAFARFLPQEAKPHYVGLEFSTQAKQMAAKDGILIENISIEEYANSHSKQFDVACSFQVLEHTSNPNSFIQAQIDCLKSDILRGGGGRDKIPYLIIAVPSQDSFLQYCVNGVLNMPPHHISRFSDKTLQEIANIFNLELLEIYHEQVQPEHIDFYKATMWAKLFLPTPLIDRGLLRKFINKAGFIGRSFIKIPPDAYGHTAVAVYTIA